MGKKLSELTEKATLIASDIMHIRTAGAIDQKITGENLKNSMHLQGLISCSLSNMDGISEPKIKTIINDYILPKYEYGNDDNTASSDLTKYHIDFLHFIYGNLRMIKRDSHFLKTIKDKIWLHSSGKKFNRPNQLYLTRKYDTHIIWEFIS